MTNNELVERVARALCIADGHDPDGPTMDIYVQDDPVAHMPWAAYRAIARAAISTIYEAVREPTEGQYKAAYDQNWGPCTAQTIWRAMIAASPLNGCISNSAPAPKVE